MSNFCSIFNARLPKYGRSGIQRERLRFFGSLVLVGLLCITLAGCSGTGSKRSDRDGAPKNPPKNLDKVPNAVPKVEPLKAAGNKYKKGGYVAKNRRYKVMSTSRGYKAKGLASWYGTKFHGRKTSSGERYDMYAMTAAHRTLPLPTYAKVTNLDNGKSVIVKVNDRGPFHKNRLIDVSYVAAHKLGMLGKGTSRVHVESVDPRDNKDLRNKRKLRTRLAEKSIDPKDLDPIDSDSIGLESRKMQVAQNRQIGQKGQNAQKGQKGKMKVAAPMAAQMSSALPIKTATAAALKVAGAPMKVAAATIKPAAAALKTPATMKTPAPMKTSEPLKTSAPMKTPPSQIAENTQMAQASKINTEPSKNSLKKQGKYYVQMGAFSQRTAALALASKIGKIAKLPTQIAEYRVKKQPMFKVRVGPVANQEEAQLLSQKCAGNAMPKPVVITE